MWKLSGDCNLDIYSPACRGSPGGSESPGSPTVQQPTCRNTYMKSTPLLNSRGQQHWPVCLIHCTPVRCWVQVGADSHQVPPPVTQCLLHLFQHQLLPLSPPPQLRRLLLQVPGGGGRQWWGRDEDQEVVCVVPGFTWTPGWDRWRCAGLPAATGRPAAGLRRPERHINTVWLGLTHRHHWTTSQASPRTETCLSEQLLSYRKPHKTAVFTQNYRC